MTAAVRPRTRAAALRVLSFALVALLAARPLASERFERLDLNIVQTLTADDGPTPATTALLDGATLLLSALLVFLGGGAPRLLVVGGGLLLAAVIVSSAAADDRAIARLAGGSMAAAVAAVGALAGAASRDRGLRRALIVAALATACTTALKSIHQVTDEHRIMRENWEQESKPKLLSQGYRADDPIVVNMERRLLAREAHGFLAHPNLNASVLAMAAAFLLGAGAGLLGDRPRERVGSSTAARTDGIDRSRDRLGSAAARTVLAVVLSLVLTGLSCTGSLGAVAALAGAAAIAGLLAAFGGAIARRPRAAMLGLVGAYGLALATLFGSGVARGGFPHPSLEFRWQYWTAGARAWSDSPLTGIGRGNFGAAYERFKRPESTEEVRDAHNVWVSLAVEMGPLGLLAGVVIAFAAVSAATRGLAPSSAADDRDAESPAAASAAQLALKWAAVAAVVSVIQAALSGLPLADRGVFLLWLFEAPIPWLIAACVCDACLSRLPRGDCLSVAAAGLLCALVAAALHAVVDFAPLVPGGSAFIGLFAAATFGAARSVAPSAAAHRIIVGTVSLCAAAHALVVVYPTLAASAALNDLEQAANLRGPDGVARVIDATRRVASSGEVAAQRIAIRTLLKLARDLSLPPTTRHDARSAAADAARALMRAHPDDSGSHRLLAQVEQLSAVEARHVAESGSPASPAAKSGSPASPAAEAARAVAQSHHRAAAAALEQAASLNPTDPRLRLAAGWAWVEVGTFDPDPSLIARARRHFDAALLIDDSRPAAEVQRLRPHEREPVEAWRRENAK